MLKNIFVLISKKNLVYPISAIDLHILSVTSSRYRRRCRYRHPPMKKNVVLRGP